MKILSSSGKTIGMSRFTVVDENTKEKVAGESRYTSGEHDNEVVWLKLTRGASAPPLESYEHWFFDAHNSPFLHDTLNVRTGIATCTSYSGSQPYVQKSQLAIPADTYAGAAELVKVMDDLRRGNRQITFHAFACVPGPRIFAIKASVPARTERWSFYPGDLVRLDMKPDLGLLNVIIAPFVPKMDAWFAPKAIGTTWAASLIVSSAAHTSSRYAPTVIRTVPDPTGRGCTKLRA
jgi:hypothetical protein